MDLETRSEWDVALEVRQDGRELHGFFPYNSTATIARQGRVRKEYFKPRAFSFAVDDPTREINLLVGHDFNRPLASRQNGTFDLIDDETGLAFTARLPPLDEQPTWMRDQVLAIRSGLSRGVSPGFTVPPANVVPNAERLIPERGNPGVSIREIAQAVLRELSVLTRGAYENAFIDVRAEIVDAPLPLTLERKARLWL